LRCLRGASPRTHSLLRKLEIHLLALALHSERGQAAALALVVLQGDEEPQVVAVNDLGLDVRLMDSVRFRKS
jgi:hypothetical protein